MITLANIITVLVSTLLLRRSVSRLLKSSNNLLDICFTVFYAMHIVPIVVEWFCDVRDFMENRYIYQAMTDANTTFVYDGACIIISLLFYYFSKKNKAKLTLRERFQVGNKTKRHTFARIIGFLLLIIPLLAAYLMAPNKDVYNTFSYFFTTRYSEFSIEYLYHREVILHSTLLSIIGLIVFYYNRTKTSLINNLIVTIGIVGMTWMDGKRAILVYALFGILVVDYLQGNLQNKKDVIKKVSFFLLITFSYFFIYAQITQKAADSTFFRSYTGYFSRLSCLKVAIYDVLYTDNILTSIGQTIPFDVFFFIPRSIWVDKPVAYCYYYTAYALTGDGSNQVHVNHLVNIWTEFTSNFGLLGILIAAVLLIKLAKWIDNSSSPITYMAGSCFILMYSMFGFEYIVMMPYALWIFSLLYFRIKKLILR